MGNGILFSILVATIAVPMAFTGDPLPRRGLRRAVKYMLLYLVLWMLACAYLYPRLV